MGSQDDVDQRENGASVASGRVRRGGFETTRWTLVTAAADLDDPDSRRALTTLCANYWYPLYSFARRRGHDRAEAEDLTQGFFAALLEKNWLEAADRRRGRFRTFLLTALKHYMANEWDRQTALKRGGAVTTLSLDVDDAEERYQRQPADETTPEEIFERSWALTTLERAVATLEREMAAAGKRHRFEALRPYLTGEGEALPYRDVAEDLGVSESAVKVAVHRLRQRFGEVLRDEIAETVTHEDVDDELRHLLDAVAA